MPSDTPHPDKSDPIISRKEPRPISLIYLLLAVSTVVVYWPVHGFNFINLDDPFMIINNPPVNHGWTIRGFLWSLTTSYFDYWHPVTWWSHITDCELFGLSAHWHHLVSLGFHVANTLLLFTVLLEMTGYMMRSAVVAALFALHPMHVESVAWLAERKDVLSTLFWLLSIWAYARYFKELQKKGVQENLYYRLSLLFFLLGLMAKPMLVTLPFVLLLLDFWPLNRFLLGRERNFWQTFLSLSREKLPFFGLTLFSCFMTISGEKAVNGIISAKIIPWSLRLTNVPVSYARYLAKLVWPVNMSVEYPLPDHWEIWRIALSIFVILAISAIVVTKARTVPYLFFGWCLFLGTIVPTISLVPVGYQSMADRFTYLPYIGLFVAIVWAVADFLPVVRFRAPLLGFATVVVLAACGVTARRQLGYWQNDFTLWPHCLAVTSENYTAYYNYGWALENAGKNKEAVGYYREAVRIRPDNADAYFNLGLTLMVTGELKEASNYFEKAIEYAPNSARAHGSLGIDFFRLGDFAGAERECAEALRLDASDLHALVYRARALAAQDKFQDALRYFSEAQRLYPTNAETRYFLGLEYAKRDMRNEAIENFSEAIKLNPASADARNELQKALESGTTAKPPGL